MEFAPDVIFEFPALGIKITSTVTTTWVIMFFLISFAYLASKNLKKEPEAGSMQNIAEAFIETITGLVDSAMGPGMRKFVPYIGTLTLYLVIANLMGIIPGRDLFKLYTPTADLNTTLALGIVTFAVTHFFAIKEKGFLGYLKGYTEPLPLLGSSKFAGSTFDSLIFISSNIFLSSKNEITSSTNPS